MCTSGKLHRPTACTISQGLNASDVACAHRLGDIGCGLCASSNDWRHRPRPVRNNRGRARRPRRDGHATRSDLHVRANDAAKGSAKIAKARTHHRGRAHQLGDIGVANGTRHQTRPGRI
ncbi:hypothetical protein H5410_014713 [Solanum commersonii]|uniref:Uncharacterized protein n=1 Tax=Solanum commersonii TaxID=4109 RepID=A0A9J5ZRQ5_SOLCO|nr:hypothetical protein H5410_014713 [Solanum commersonii]